MALTSTANPRTKHTTTLLLHSNLSPPLTHFTSLLEHISTSEQGLCSILQTTSRELSLLHSYFTSTTTQIESLTNIIKDPLTNPFKRQAALDEKKRKLSEIDEMKRYEEEIKKLEENIREREQVERRLRSVLKEAGELLILREKLARKGGKEGGLVV